MKNKIKTITILNVKISKVSRQEAIELISKWCEEKAKRMVVTPNPEQVMMVQKDLLFRKILNEAWLALPDGVGLVWASKLGVWSGELEASQIIKERVTGEEVMKELISLARDKGWRVMLVGGRKSTAEKASEKFQSSNIGKEFSNHEADKGKSNSNFQIKGIEGIRNIRSYSNKENEAINKKINKFKPHILFVAYGAPWQEKWLAENLRKLDIKVGMVVGGALDMVVDPTLRPPEFMTCLGLDWFYRLIRQPWRIKRQLSLIEFLFLVCIESFQIRSR